MLHTVYWSIHSFTSTRWTRHQTYPFLRSATESLSVPRRIHSYSSRFLPSSLQTACLSFTHTNFVPVPLCFPFWSPAGPTTSEACWSETARRLNVTGPKGFSWGEKAHIPLSVKQLSIVSAGLPSKQTWNYSISVCHMSGGAAQRRWGVLWWSM